MPWKKRVTLLLLVVLATRAASNGVLYQRMFKGEGLTVTGQFSVYEPLTRIRCASACSMATSCVVWTWDAATNRCHVYSFLDATTSRTTASNSLETFGRIVGYFFENFPGPVTMSWAQAKIVCENQGALLAHVPDHEVMKLLMQWVGYANAWVGIWREPSAATWFDVNNNAVASLYWATNEPEDPYQWGSYRSGSGGLVTTPTTARTYLPLCKML